MTIPKKIVSHNTDSEVNQLEEKKRMGHEMKVVTNLMKRNIAQSSAFTHLEHMTGTQGWVIKYLFDHRDEAIFQRDLETEFSVRRSTITGIIQLMEKNGLIIRESVENDARLKKLVLTEKAIQLHHMVEETLEEFNQNLCDGITEEEKEVFFRVMDKMKDNLMKQK